jgi:flavin reductase (DIM6/NTAB) family NADH-FMN oxidoreductase RutF
VKISIGAQTVLFPTPVFIVSTYDSSGKPNAMAVAWGGICCSAPPCVAVSLREATYTYGNIMERKAFIVNIPSQKHIKEVDYLGVASGKKEDKFAAAGLTPCKSGIVDAPYIKEFPLNLACRLINTVKIGLHTQFIGEIKDILVDEDMLEAQGVPGISKIKPLIFNPANRGYYSVGAFLSQAFSAGKRA